MNNSQSVKYPVGEQSFELLRKDGYLYVDKTPYIETLLRGSKYYFLGRPRRFGKSLFLSTLKCFFEGKRELFKGLYADSMDWYWEEYPVLYLDLNNRRYQDEEKLDYLIEDFLSYYENEYGIDKVWSDFSGRFANLIRRVSEKTGKGVVILVDEYDKPLVNNLHDHEQFEYLRSRLAELYSNFKSCADYIRMVFLTGVSRFGKLSVFSDLNNIRDISLVNDFAGICGISEEELIENFKIGISELADGYEASVDQTIAELKCRYDGYHFARKSPDMYNPFSLLNVFESRQYGNYWIESGTPSLLRNYLKHYRTDLQRLMSVRSTASQLSGLDMENMDVVALLYQTGYLTIKRHDAKNDIYYLGIPNDEVKEGFLSYLLPSYANLHHENSNIFVFEFREEMEEGRVEDFMRRLQSMFADVSYEMRMDEERNVQNALFLLFRLIGMNADVEYRTSEGRIDILVRTDNYVYIIELKYNHSAEEALQQIIEKDYALPWATDNRRTIAIGINFSTEKRTIDSWLSRQI